MALLEVKDLKTAFKTDDGVVQAVDGISFSVEKGETLAIVGESGCGKSVTCMSIMGLLPRQNTVHSGQAVLSGRDLLAMSSDDLRQVRGTDVAMIFQDPMTSLNPVHTVGRQLREAIEVHENVSKDRARARSLEMMRAVGIPRAETRLDDYPHQFSGGMRQRVMIAMSLINNPDLLIADEPTTALDVTVQAQILDLIDRLQSEFNTAVALITHDLGVVAEHCDHIQVMYAGKIVEEGTADDIYYRPMMPYTWGLLRSLPRLGHDTDRLTPIAGAPPSLIFLPDGCSFSPRCPYVFDECRVIEPDLLPIDGHHAARCLLSLEDRERIVAQEILATP